MFDRLFFENKKCQYTHHEKVPTHSKEKKMHYSNLLYKNFSEYLSPHNTCQSYSPYIKIITNYYVSFCVSTQVG